jgi:hypothetical protein
MLADGNAFSVRVKQYFLEVKAISVVRLGRTIDAVSVELSSNNTWQEYMPVMRSAICYGTEFYNSLRLLSFSVIKEYDLDLCGMR